MTHLHLITDNSGSSRGSTCELPLEHEIDLVLCSDLEKIADGLPKLPDTPALRILTERLRQASERWADLKWEAVLGGSEAWNARMIDSLHAEDVAAMLWRHYRRSNPTTTGQLSYMLRALFDGRRRAVALEACQLGCENCAQSSDSA